MKRTRIFEKIARKLNQVEIRLIFNLKDRKSESVEREKREPYKLRRKNNNILGLKVVQFMKVNGKET